MAWEIQTWEYKQSSTDGSWNRSLLSTTTIKSGEVILGWRPEEGVTVPCKLHDNGLFTVVADGIKTVGNVKGIFYPNAGSVTLKSVQIGQIKLLPITIPLNGVAATIERPGSFAVIKVVWRG